MGEGIDDDSQRETIDATPPTHGDLPTPVPSRLELPLGQPDGELPARIGRFVPIACIGRGGMGEVHAAYDPQLDRKIAIKRISQHRKAATDPRARERTLREARALAKLTHPNVVAVYDVGTVEGDIYIAMEFIDGRPLDAWLGERPPWRAVVQAFTAAGRGLAAAHAAELIHRDFKPGNVVRAHDGRVVVLDFGLARTPTVGGIELAPASVLDPKATEGGALLGTPAYMSPEQWRGLPIDARSDQFNFCVALWEALCRSHPFDRTSTLTLANSVSTGDVREPPHDVEVPRRVLKVVRRGLAVAPERRWPSMEALLQALTAAAAPPRWPLAAAGVTALAATVWFTREPPPTAPVDPCIDAAARIDTAWNEQRRGSIAAAFAAIDLGFAPDVWLRVEPELDAWARAWSAAASDACVARQRDDEDAVQLSRRDACVSAALHRFDALVERLGHAQADTAERATSSVAALPALERCADASRLAPVTAATTGEASPPGELEPLQAQLAALMAALDTADRDAIATLSGPVQDAVDAVTDVGLQVEMLRALGTSAWMLGDATRAREQLTRAATTAMASGLDEPFVETVTELVGYMTVLGAGLEVGQTWWSVAEAALRRGGASTRAEVGLLRAGGFLAMTHQQLARAHELAAKAVTLGSEQLGDAHVLTLEAKADLARIALLQHDYDAALSTYAKLVEGARDTFGPLHPNTIELRSFELQARIEAGRIDGVVEAALALPAAFEASQGPRAGGIVWSLALLGSAHLARGDYREAAADFAAGHARLLAAHGPDYRASGLSAEQAAALVLAGDLEAAWAAAQTCETEARDALHDAGDDAAVELASALIDVTRVALATDHRRRAAELVSEIDALHQRRAPDDDSRAVIDVLAAQLALAEGDAVLARTRARAALQWLGEHDLVAPSLEVDALALQAQSEWQSGDARRGLTTAQLALSRAQVTHHHRARNVQRAAAQVVLAALATGELAAADDALATVTAHPHDPRHDAAIDPTIVAELAFARIALADARGAARSATRAALDALALPNHAVLVRRHVDALRRLP
ncbi:MAG: protein kinase [Deltaproteobacteria bacterium]|nr:protein kinase [Deltaproteobacteria bacterium]